MLDPGQSIAGPPLACLATTDGALPRCGVYVCAEDKSIPGEADGERGGQYLSEVGIESEGLAGGARLRRPPPRHLPQLGDGGRYLSVESGVVEVRRGAAAGTRLRLERLLAAGDAAGAEMAREVDWLVPHAMAGVQCSLVRVGPRQGAQPLEAAAVQAAARLLQASRSLRLVRQEGGRRRLLEAEEAAGRAGAGADAWRVHPARDARPMAWEEVRAAGVEAEVGAEAGQEAATEAAAEVEAGLVRLSVVCSDTRRGLLDLVAESPAPLSLEQLGARVDAGAVRSSLIKVTLTSEQQVRTPCMHSMYCAHAHAHAHAHALAHAHAHAHAHVHVGCPAAE